MPLSDAAEALPLRPALQLSRRSFCTTPRCAYVWPSRDGAHDASGRNAYQRQWPWQHSRPTRCRAELRVAELRAASSVSTADSVDVSVFGGTVASSSRVALPADEGRRAVGTPDYLAPELLLGEFTSSCKRFDRRSLDKGLVGMQLCSPKNNASMF